MTTITIRQITIVHSHHGPDAVFLYVDLPNPTPNVPSVSGQLPTLKLDCEAGTARQYCQSHFSEIEPTIISR